MPGCSGEPAVCVQEGLFWACGRVQCLSIEESLLSSFSEGLSLSVGPMSGCRAQPTVCIWRKACPVCVDMDLLCVRRCGPSLPIQKKASCPGVEKSLLSGCLF